MAPEKSALKLPGLFFGPGELFSSRQSAQQAYHALLGDSDARKKLSLDAAKLQVSSRTTQLFQLCLDHQGLYTAVRGGNLFWDTIATHWDVSCDLSGVDVEEIVGVFTNAFNVYKGGIQTPLTQSIRQWTTIAQGVTQMAPAAQLQIPHHPHPVAAASSDLEGLHIGPAQQPIDQGKWPDLYFNHRELAWMSDVGIRDQLAGVVPFQPQRAQQLPAIPNAYSHPLSTKLFLCFCALANYKQAAPWALHMNPIAFLGPASRRQWYNATGSLSKMQSTLEEFVDYAREATQNEGRSVVCGMFTNWKGTPQTVTGSYPQESNQPHSELWVQLCKRSGVVIVLFRLDGNSGFRLAIFDPTMAYQHLQEPMTMQGNAWKADIVKVMKESFHISEVWQGGITSGALSELGIPLNDSVELCCGFI